jgi:uncharacterized membrane protein
MSLDPIAPSATAALTLVKFAQNLYGFRLTTMSDLVCVPDDKPDTADAVLNELRVLKAEHLIDPEDACVVVRDENGKAHLKQRVNLVTTGAASGANWGGLMGLMVRLLLLNPLIGRAAGL